MKRYVLMKYQSFSLQYNNVLFLSKISDVELQGTHFEQRKRKIDDTENEEKRASLKQVSPWIPMFTPEAESVIKAPPKRPQSPMTGRPIRSKELIPINLIEESRDSDSSDTSSHVRFICPVSRKTITNQKVILIKSTKQIMLESVAQQLAYPTMTCPITGQLFTMDDVIELSQAASSFAASGAVETSKYRPAL